MKTLKLFLLLVIGGGTLGTFALYRFTDNSLEDALFIGFGASLLTYLGNRKLYTKKNPETKS